MPLATAPVASAESGLQRLLELELVLEQRLAAARRESEQLLGEARDKAATLAAQAAEQQAADELRLVARIGEEHSKASAELDAELARSAAHFQDLAPERVDRIARQLLEWLLDPSR